ncbi:MAG TPA: discoidin domain-containing protein [Anaerohalosphaeraceae bacterium]|nr:discoidin domain-containing protein [Anaerohalosphaeraceae bacterium]
MRQLFLIIVLSCLTAVAGAALKNVSTGKQATASSLWGGSNANLLTDGIVDSGWPIAHTNSGDYNPWMMIDLTKTELIKEITLWNRKDCCWARFRDLQIEILDQNQHAVYVSEVLNKDNSLNITTYETPSMTLKLENTIPGQYIRVRRIPYSTAADDGYALQLNELQVFADGKVASTASAPSPYHGENFVPLQATLSWDASLLDDPNTPEPPYQNTAVISQKLYLSSGDADDPNVFLLATIPAGAQRIGFGPITIKRDGVYYWRVDEVLPEKTITGPLWKFNAIGSAPMIDSAAPAAQRLFQGQDAVFTVSAVNPFTGDVSGLRYAWFKSADNANNTEADDIAVGTNASTLLIPNVQAANEGYYYCKVNNDEGYQSISKTAVLVVKRLMAHYKFDQVTDAAGVYTDAAGSYPANMVTPAYTRTYVAGIDGDAIVMDASSMANAGTWDPSSLTNEITVSCWVKWAGLRGSGTYQGIVGKADTWGTANGATNKWYWRTDNNVATLRWFRNSIYGPNITLTGGGQWQFLCMTVANNTATAYVNGIRIGSSAFTFGGGNTNPIWIGVAENNMTRWFNGAIDDLRIYNYAVSYESIVDLYNAAVDPDISVCLYKTENIRPDTDLNNDCRVDLQDFVLLLNGWMDCGLYPDSYCN